VGSEAVDYLFGTQDENTIVDIDPNQELKSVSIQVGSKNVLTPAERLFGDMEAGADHAKRSAWVR
jgi:hypothetical protein